MSDMAKRSEFGSNAASAESPTVRRDARPPQLSRWAFVATLQTIDALVVVLTALGAGAYALRHAAPPAAMIGLCLACGALLACLLHLVLRAQGGYRLAAVLQRGRSTALLLLTWIGLTAPLLALVRLHGADGGGLVAQAWLDAWTLSGGVLLVGARLLHGTLGQALLASGVLGQAICIVGSGEAAASCAERARRDPYGTVVIGYFDDRDAEGQGVPGLSRLGTLADVLPFLQRQRLDAVVVALPLAEQDRISDIVTVLRRHPIRVLLAPWFEAAGDKPFTMPSMVSDIGGMALYPVSDRPIAGWAWVFKDLQDRSLALAVLLFISPVMAAIALAIRLSSPGPVLFRQNRRGYGARPFRIFKFRTMHQAASVPTTRLTLTTRDDPRIFPVGGFLRRTSLDELPQLLNVIAGDMWLVGPRPHSPLAEAAGTIYVDAVTDYIARYRIKPGITGWAQVNGWRGPTDTLEQIDGRVRCDLFYIEHWSPWFDLRIAIATVTRGLKHDNAF